MCFSLSARCMLMVLTMVFLYACGTNYKPVESRTFKEEGLSEITVFTLKKDNDWLYAGTDRGLHRTTLSKILWRPIGIDDTSFRTFSVFSKQEFLASANFDNGDSLTIAKTTDGGQTWIPFRNGFGGVTRTIPLALEVHPQNEDILYARGLMNVARSNDRGKSWESVYLKWDNIGTALFVKINSRNPDMLWAGGSKPTFAPHLIKSTDGGNSWMELTPIENVETGVHDIVIHPNNSDNVLIGMAGAIEPANIIRKSTDGGQHWQTVFEGAGIRTLAQSPGNGRTVYAGGINAQGTLFFAVSPDFGDTWQTVEMQEGPAGITVNDMVSVMADGMEVLYLGTNQGVYSYTFEE